MFNFCTSNLHQVPLTPSFLGFLNYNMKQLLKFGFFFSPVTYNIYHCPLFNILKKIHPMGCLGLFTLLLTSSVSPMFHSKMVISHWPNNWKTRIGGDFWILQGCGWQGLYSFLGNHLDTRSCHVCGQSYDCGTKYDKRHYRPWYQRPTLWHCSFIHVHLLVKFVIWRRRTILGIGFRSMACPWSFYSFGTYALLVNIETLHIDRVKSLKCWLFLHNVNNKTCF
jgi:hypothetical protein